MNDSIHDRAAALGPWYQGYEVDGCKVPVSSVATNLPSRLAHLHEIVAMIPRPRGTLLDVGCNAGWFDVHLAAEFETVTGIDHKEQFVEQANLMQTVSEYHRANCRFLVGSLASWTESADVVLAMQVLAHQSDQWGTFQRMTARTRRYLLLETSLFRSDDPMIRINEADYGGMDSFLSEGLLAVYCRRARFRLVAQKRIAPWSFDPRAYQAMVLLEREDGSGAL